MAGSLTRGYKTVVMTRKEWEDHPDRCIYQGKPGLSDGVKPWINVIFNG